MLTIIKYKNGHATDECAPILAPAFKLHKAKPVPETELASSTAVTTNPSLIPNLTLPPAPNLAASPPVPSHCHHPPFAYPGHHPSWHNLLSQPSFASCAHTCNGYHPQPSYHNFQPQPVHHGCYPHPPVTSTYPQPPMGPLPPLIGPFGQNQTVIDDFCATYGLDDAARDSLKRLMSGAPPGV
jgi:hypothetical protein